MNTLTLPLPRFAAARYMADHGFPFAFLRERRTRAGWVTTGRVPAWVLGFVVHGGLGGSQSPAVEQDKDMP